MSVAASGTQAATLDTEHTLAQTTTPGTYLLSLDLAAMAVGDVVHVELRTRVLAAGVTRPIYAGTFQHAQSTPIKQSIAVKSEHDVVATLTQTDGTARSFPWELLRLDA